MDRLHKKINIINNKGFTLIELMVVVVIIAILAIVGITVYSGQQASARDSRRRQDIDSIGNALEAHFNPVANANCSSGAAGTYCSIDSNLQATWFAAGSVPVDPIGSNGYVYTYTPAGAGTVLYAGASTYVVCAKLENTNGTGNSSSNTSINTVGPLQYYCRQNQQT
ncbi:type II secretion system protein [Candidatus Daviesbacteria bacterium]|nr:type II secretion system protein [Candidatus Daviesbacteria bacterium]